jgi:hypothetical protein
VNTAVEKTKRSDWLGFSVYLSLACWVLLKHKQTLIWVPFFALDLLFARSFLTRKPLQAQGAGWQPRLAGYLGTLLPLIFFQLSACYFPGWIQLNTAFLWQFAGLLLVLAGLTLEIWTILHLQDSFSIIPQARALVVSGTLSARQASALHRVPSALLRHVAGCGGDRPFHLDACSLLWCDLLAGAPGGAGSI